MEKALSSTNGEFNFSDAKLGKIPLSKIRENQEALRTTVEKDTEEYKGLVDSVRRNGIMQPILVRELEDPVSGELFYGLVDGLHRYNAAMDAGLEEIPANIGTLEEGSIIEAQILANVHRIETKAVQYTKALIKVLSANPLLTMSELAARLSKSLGWLEDRLSLDKLTEEIQKLVDSDKMPLMNAYALAKLPKDEQQAFLQAAIGQSPAEFGTRVQNRKKELNKARAEGRAATEEVFIPVERLRAKSAFLDEITTLRKDPSLSKIVGEAKRLGITSVEDVTKLAIEWSLSVDPSQIKLDEEKWKTEKALAAQEKERKKREKEAKKQQEAAVTANA